MQQVIVHIGYPKAGSTFLQNYFSQHPDIYYSGNLAGNYVRSGKLLVNVPAEAALKKFLVISEEQLSVWQGNLDIVGVKFNHYNIKAHQLEICQTLHRQFPLAKILIVTRGFGGALGSTYSQYITIGGILDFDNFRKEFGEIFAEFYDYNYLLNTYRHQFGAENVVVVPFELLKQDNSTFLSEIENLCVLPHRNFDTGAYNESLQDAEMHSYLSLSKKVYAFTKVLPNRWQPYVYGAYVMMLYKRKLHGLLGLFSSGKGDFKLIGDLNGLFKGKAEILRNEKLFQPYLKEYLL